jgi:hypothetical protein
MSDYKEERKEAGQALSAPSKFFKGEQETFARQLES